MKSLSYILCRLSCIVFVFIMVSCNNDAEIDEIAENLYSVNFTIDGFSTTKRPLSSNAGPIRKLGSTGTTKTSTDDEEYLCFWSFNNANVLPDLSIAGASLFGITYNDGVIPTNFPNSTYAHVSYPAGKAMSVNGGRELYIKIPIKLATTVTGLGFDIGSTDIGPKDFELYYSLDEGASYEVLALNNQFGTLSNNGKNSFVYDLKSKNISGNVLWFKVILKAGKRAEGGGEYAASGGTFRIDNLYLKGTSERDVTHRLKKLHYTIFHQDNNQLVYSGNIDYEDHTAIQVQLPLGKYYFCFVSNASNTDLLTPQNPLWKSFYVGNVFSNAKAEIFGYHAELDVEQSIQLDVKLDRWYSQVKLEFTDAINLQQVRKIRVSQEHEPFYYAPFSQLTTNPILDQSDIDFVVDLNDQKFVLFNQFMGSLSKTVPVSYKVDVFGEKDLIRSFSINSILKNNMQLVFRGELLKDVTQSSGFKVIKNEEWGDEKEEEF